MPQNQSSNKVSSIIGFLLLAGIVGFTVFISFFVEKTSEEVVEVKTDEEVEKTPLHKDFTKIEIGQLWQLEGVESKRVVIPNKEKELYMSVNKRRKCFGFTFLNDIDEYERDFLSKDSSYIHYGILKFNRNERMQMESFELLYYDMNSVASHVGHLIAKFQISSIDFLPKNNYFTCINFNDSSKVFLIKDNESIKNTYYKEFIKEAKFLNDSTKLYLPKVE
ncbi:hypothetical protein ACE193_20855 [Bernardetia sp. OM2101]|uniref:hypothetical protein n=1 Tax=Bernardetia sp. OM2101 TaxID=3344876 RepID=UPI0035D0E3B2